MSWEVAASLEYQIPPGHYGAFLELSLRNPASNLARDDIHDFEGFTFLEVGVKDFELPIVPEGSVAQKQPIPL